MYYVGPRQTPQPARVKLDISANETVVRPPVLRDIAHPYPDGPLPGRVRCYSFEEVFAEKIRAMAQRARPRDLYDIVNLFRRNDLRLYPEVIRKALHEKCAAKNIGVPTAADFIDSPLIAALESDWSQMLSHQLPALPPLRGFLDELPLLFGWLEGTAEFEELPPLPGGADEEAWSPPPTVATWRGGHPAGDRSVRRHQPSLRGAVLQRRLATHRAVLASTQQRRSAPSPRRTLRWRRASNLRHRQGRRAPSHHCPVQAPLPHRVLRPWSAPRPRPEPDCCRLGSRSSTNVGADSNRAGPHLPMHAMRQGVPPRQTQRDAPSPQRPIRLPLRGPTRHLPRDSMTMPDFAHQHRHLITHPSMAVHLDLASRTYSSLE